MTGNQRPDSKELVRQVTVNVEALQEILGLLLKAAELAAQAGFPPDAFTAAAWQSYVMASPGLAEHIAEMQFEAALEEWRKSGRLAKA